MKSRLVHQIARFLRLNRRNNFKAVSQGDLVNISNKLESSWQDESIPDLQWAVVEPQIKSLRKGTLTPEFETLIRILQSIPEVEELDRTCLEIGCSSGYYSEVISKYFPKIDYKGCDYSTSFIAKANELYPQSSFSVEDTTALSFPDQSFDITISGSVLLHVPDWEKGLSETIRVSRRYMILHRTPVYLGKTRLFTKHAYGKEVIEWSFSKDDVIQKCVELGFDLVREINVYQDTKISKDINMTIQQSFLFERRVR